MKASYSPHRDPDPEEWLQTDESERLRQVKAYHLKKKIRIPGFESHAATHVTVENQLAEGKPANVRATLARLMADGLSRHDAIHAIGCLVMEGIYRVMHEGAPFDAAEYERELETLTRDSWTKRFGG